MKPTQWTPTHYQWYSEYNLCGFSCIEIKAFWPAVVKILPVFSIFPHPCTRRPPPPQNKGQTAISLYHQGHPPHYCYQRSVSLKANIFWCSMNFITKGVPLHYTCIVGVVVKLMTLLAGDRKWITPTHIWPKGRDVRWLWSVNSDFRWCLWAFGYISHLSGLRALWEFMCIW